MARIHSDEMMSGSGKERERKHSKYAAKVKQKKIDVIWASN